MSKLIAHSFIIVFIVQIVALGAQTISYDWNNEAAIAEVKQRVSLDTSLLDLGVKNNVSVANTRDIARYMANLNLYLEKNEFPIRILGLNSVETSEVFNQFPSLMTLSLPTNEQSLMVKIGKKPFWQSWQVSYLAIIAGLVYFFFWPKRHKTRPVAIEQERNATPNVVAPAPAVIPQSKTLVIDFKQKALYLENESQPVEMSNKPFCFYVALIRYCLDEDVTNLIHHEPIPDSLLEKANESFQQLMEIGHTKRKQPDFSTNLDKTLSEIRAALDQVFANSSDDKCQFYPPKAYGEGSRTKRHCYGLNSIKKTDIQWIFE